MCIADSSCPFACPCPDHRPHGRHPRLHKEQTNCFRCASNDISWGIAVQLSHTVLSMQTLIWTPGHESVQLWQKYWTSCVTITHDVGMSCVTMVGHDVGMSGLKLRVPLLGMDGRRGQRGWDRGGLVEWALSCILSYR